MNDIILLLLQCVYILIPAYIANMLPPLAKKFNLLQSLVKPVDNNKHFSDGRPIFGKNKTYRGMVFGIIGGVLGGIIFYLLYPITVFNTFSLPGLDYTNLGLMILLGALMGFGALIGDLIESFIKRRLNIGPGEKFIPWDQTDLVFGAYLLAIPVLYPYISFKLFLFSIIVTFFLHIAVNHISYYLGIRGERW